MLLHLLVLAAFVAAILMVMTSKEDSKSSSRLAILMGIAFAAMWLIVGGHPVDVLVCMLAYGSFGCIYISSNILAQRIVGLSGNRGIFITFYMGIMVALMIPGIAAGILMVTAVPEEWLFMASTVIGLPVVIWNLFISLMIFLLCRNLLNNIE